MTIIDALILGIIQGLTEFLPISSSGHLELGKVFLGIETEKSLLFTVVVHGATVLSTLVVFRREIGEMLKDLLKIKWNHSTKFIVKLAISAIPIGSIGLIFQSEIETYFFGNILLVGSMLMVTGILLLFSTVPSKYNKNVTYWGAFVIGLSQVLAILPGISRSGATIATGLYMGVKRELAAQFSFLMVLAPIIAANAKSIVTGEINGSTVNFNILLVGFITAFIFGYIACAWMIKIVKKGKLIYFAYYCFAVGAVVILSKII